MPSSTIFRVSGLYTILLLKSLEGFVITVALLCVYIYNKCSLLSTPPQGTDPLHGSFGISDVM